MTYPNITSQEVRDELARTLRRWNHKAHKFRGESRDNPVNYIYANVQYWHYLGYIFGLRCALDVIDRGG